MEDGAAGVRGAVLDRVGVAMAIGLGIMIAVSRGLKSNIEIKR